MDVASIVTRWENEQPQYKKLGEVVYRFINREIKELGISPIISSRTKEILSIIKKIRKRQKDEKTYSYESLTDKLGVRIICNFNSDLEKVHGFLDKYFTVVKTDLKKSNLNFDKLDYQSNHYDVKLKPTTFKNHVEYHDLVFEIQARTINQNAWADVAHSLIYKQESDIDEYTKRRIFRLIALYELADDEFNSINDLITSMPDNYVYSLLKKIEDKFYRIARCEFDKEYSIMNLKTILTFLSDSQKDLLHKNIESFIATNENKIRQIFQENKDYYLSSSYLTQPEIFVIWYSLVNFEYYITSNWLNHFDYQELEDIANWWGLNIEQSS